MSASWFRGKSIRVHLVVKEPVNMRMHLPVRRRIEKPIHSRCCRGWNKDILKISQHLKDDSRRRTLKIFASAALLSHNPVVRKKRELECGQEME